MSDAAITIVRECGSAELTGALARGVARALLPGDVVTLAGELGAGKTVFARALALELGVDPGVISSPTYVLVNQYPAKTAALGEFELVHADLYRLSDADDLEALGWDRLVGPGTIVVAEWPERASGAFAGVQEKVVRVEIEATSAASRRITVTAPGAWRSRAGLAALLTQPPVICPVTGKAVAPGDEAYPFADGHARMADLGRWLSGGYTTWREPGPEDADGV